MFYSVATFLVFLDLPNGTLRHSWRETPVRYVLISDSSEWNTFQMKELFNCMDVTTVSVKSILITLTAFMDMRTLNASICIECMENKKIINDLLLGGLSEYCLFGLHAGVCSPKNISLVFEVT
jgi:hypothetical protein